jgi:hypothetical protein
MRSATGVALPVGWSAVFSLGGRYGNRGLNYRNGGIYRNVLAINRNAMAISRNVVHRLFRNALGLSQDVAGVLELGLFGLGGFDPGFPAWPSIRRSGSFHNLHLASLRPLDATVATNIAFPATGQKDARPWGWGRCFRSARTGGVEAQLCCGRLVSQRTGARTSSAQPRLYQHHDNGV